MVAACLPLMILFHFRKLRTLFLNSAAFVERFAAGQRLSDIAVWRDVARDPDIAADSRSAPNNYATQNGRAGVDHHVVFNDRMARVALDQRAVLADRKTLGAQRHGLIQAHPPADLRSLTD